MICIPLKCIVLGVLRIVFYFQGNYSGKEIVFRFENLVVFYVTSTYVPALIMLVVGCCTFFFPVKDFQDRVMVAITALLVDAAFFTQVSSSIPKTAYLKMVDVWFVFCIACLFFVILSLTIINYIYFYEECSLFIKVQPHSYKKSAPGRDINHANVLKATRLNRILAFLFPTVITVFIAVYVVISFVSLAAVKNQ